MVPIYKGAKGCTAVFQFLEPVDLSVPAEMLYQTKYGQEEPHQDDDCRESLQGYSVFKVVYNYIKNGKIG